MTISKIEIENIRGFEKISLDVELRPNCTNIIVAPNGFGKSSISTAFHCARGNRLDVPSKDRHRNNENDSSILKITLDGMQLEATTANNEISSKINVHVIKSNIEPKAKLPKINGYTVAKPYLEIPPMDLGKACDNVKIDFDKAKICQAVGANSKVVPNFAARCNDLLLRRELHGSFEHILRLTQKTASDLLDTFIQEIDKHTGTKITISNKLEKIFEDRFKESTHINALMQVFEKHVPDNCWVENAISVYILMDLNNTDRKNLKGWLQYAIHHLNLQARRAFVNDINAAWVGAEIKEAKGRVVVNFPDASSLSNGQRDLLYFGCRLLQTRDAAVTKPSILIIDEVFDYLDDANIAVAQYFLSKLIEQYRSDGNKLYVCLLTHLDPVYFKGYALKRQNIVYLGESSQAVTETMKKVISKRDDALWASDLSKYFLHYHPTNRDISAIFNTNFGLPKKHGKSHNFYEFLRAEWEKCISGGNYDPFAVCAHVRVEIERCIFHKISAAPDRDTFLDSCNGTAKKIEFAETIGIDVPESCLLAGVIYNDAMHRKGAIDQSSTISLKLRNLGLQNILKQAISW